MKSILLSIKPKWIVKILNGEKTIEVVGNTATIKDIHGFYTSKINEPFLNYLKTIL